MSSNPFNKFAARPIKIGSWLHTKKAGRDDEKIAFDKRKAKLARKSEKLPTKLNSLKDPTKKRIPPKKRKRQYYSDDDDDNESVDSFIVDDNEPIEEEISSSEEEECFTLVKSRHKKAPQIQKKLKKSSLRKNTKHKRPSIESEDEILSEVEVEFNSESEGDDNPDVNHYDENSSTDLGEPAFEKSSKPQKHVKSSFKKSSLSKNPSHDKKKIMSPYFSKSEEKKEEIDLTKEKCIIDILDKSDSTVAEQICLRRAMRESLKDSTINVGISSTKQSKMKRTIKKSLSSSPVFIKRNKRGKILRSEYVRTDENRDLEDAIKASLQVEANKKGKYFANVKVSGEPKSTFNAKKKEKNLSTNDRLKNTSKKKKRIIIEEDSESNPDSPVKSGKKVFDTEDEESVEENEEHDEYHNPESEEATNVLQTTKLLSSEILSRMSQWYRETKSSGQSQEAKQNENTGMIVDGALSLSLCESKKHQLLVQREDVENLCNSLKLADYQLLGVNWMALLNGMTCSIEEHKSKSNNVNNNVNGVLADEMGLGKTVQTIAFLGWLKYGNKGSIKSKSTIPSSTKRSMEACNHSKPHIIIVPASVLSNWENEFKKFCPNLSVVKYHGNMNKRLEIQAQLKKCLPTVQDRKPLDVVLTTFSYFSSEKADDRNFLRKFKFDYMIVDEAHCLKNAKGLRYINMDKFSTSHRLLLTGTPVQNSPKELMSLLCFLMPLFSQRAHNALDEGGNNGGAHMLEHFVSLDANSNEKHAYRKLKQLLAPFVLRRKKLDVLGQILPPKTRKLELVPFDEKMRKVYASLLASHVENRKNGTKLATKHLFTSLRKAANHPLLLRSRHTKSKEIEHLALQLFTGGFFGRDATCTLKLVRNELENFSDYDIHCAALDLINENPLRAKELERYILQQDDLFCSPKFDRLRILLPELVKENHRVLIFSQWTKCLDLLGCLMESIDFKYLRLDGQTDIAERQHLIDQFNNDSTIPVFLLSTRAGGMGINLTSADTCILHDLDFNPFNDLQAEDRCHRIGQKRPVTVIKMVTADTVDASIYSMQERKAKMNEAILENNDTRNGEKGNCRKEDDIAINAMVEEAMTQFEKKRDV